MGITVRRTTEDDWVRMRALRLQALQDTPMAYLQTYERALELGEDDWREYAARGQESGRTFVVAVDDESGEFVGMMGGATDRDGGAPYLVAVFVAPEWRGARHGVTDLLLEAIEDWARERGGALQLDVHEDNLRAKRYYENHGFVPTGKWMPYPLDRSKRELNMIKRL
ncbi:GNAT family N-acetyltransferase [Gryllotalpicola ginsengisoli]|uniref:GNAT family N-acetyltransferase n=1 Tax=Gryllotalpicola ginsengisoli TaxID=444608 RepID=UPI0003B6B49B|nr:GNAT family N-acetyltransferase [Gryllotalpicola ginsengisoli]